MRFEEFDIPKLPSGEKATGWLEVASRADGGSWRLPLLYVKGTAAGPTLAVTAAVHGDEYEGVEAVPRIFDQVYPSTLKGTLVMIAVCNMPAYEAGIRSSPIDGLNLARVFPGDPEGTVTQRIPTGSLTDSSNRRTASSTFTVETWTPTFRRWSAICTARTPWVNRHRPQPKPSAHRYYGGTHHRCPRAEASAPPLASASPGSTPKRQAAGAPRRRTSSAMSREHST